MKVGTIIYTLGLYTVVAVPAFVLTAKSLELDISDTFAMISSGSIPEQAIESDEIQKRIMAPEDYLYLSEMEQELETLAPASGETEDASDDDLVQKILETEAQNKAAFDKIFSDQ